MSEKEKEIEEKQNTKDENRFKKLKQCLRKCSIFQYRTPMYF